MLRSLAPVLALATLGASAAWAQSAPPLAARSGLLDVYQQAAVNNADLAAARAQYQARREVVPQARAGLLPFLGASAEVTDTRTEFDTDSGSRSLSRSGSAYQASLSQPLFRADRWFQLKAAQAISEQAALQLSIAEQELILRSAQAYFAVLQAQDNLAALKAEEAAFKRQLEQADERFEVGLSDRTDVLEAQAGFDTAQANRSIAQRQVEDAFQALFTLTNREYRALEGIQHSLPVLAPVPNDAGAWVDSATQQNLNLLAVNQAVTAAEQTLRQRRAGHAPTVDAVAAYRRGNNDSLGFTNAQSIPGIPLPRYTGDVEQHSIGLQLNIPIYSGGLTSSQGREAYHQLEATEQQRESLRRQVVEAARNLHRAVNTDIDQVQARRQTIVSSQSALEATEIGYQVGTRNIVDVLDTQRRLYAAVRNYNNARYDYILDTLRLKQVAGTLNPDDLAALSQFLKTDYDPDRDFLPPDLSQSVGKPVRLE